MAPGSVRLERAESIGVVVLDRVERHNALDERMWSQLAEVVAQLEASPPRAVVVTGAGDDAFCAGLDMNPSTNPPIARLVEAVHTGDAEPVQDLLRAMRRTVDRLCGLPRPVIAAVNGLAYGVGVEIAVRADLRVVDAQAVLSFVGARVGLMPIVGGGAALARLVGPGRATDLLLTARKLRATEALGMGLVSRLSEPSLCLQEALRVAHAITQNSPRAVRSMLDGLRRSGAVPLAEAMEQEAAAAEALVRSGEFLHGLRAALDKEAPVFPDLQD